MEYDSGSGKVQNVHTKQWKSTAESDKMVLSQFSSESKIIPQEREKKLEDKVGFAHPNMLQAYTPQV